MVVARCLAAVLAAVLVVPTGGSVQKHLRALHGGRQHGHSSGHASGHAAALTAQEEKATNGLAEVIELLSTMLKNFNDQAVEDKENWAEYSEWSDESEADKNEYKSEQAALVMASEAKKSANQQSVAKLTEDLAGLAKDIKETKDSIAELMQMRHEEHQEFEAGLADVTKTIRAVTKATEILEGHYGASLIDKASLAEIRTRVKMALTMYSPHMDTATTKNVKILTSLLQGGKSGGDQSAPDFLNTDGSKYASYEKQGGSKGVIGMLDDLRSQLESQKQELISNENDARKQYEETKAAKEASQRKMEGIQAEKLEKKAKCESTIEQMIATIAEANQEIADSETYLTALLKDRATFQKQFAERTVMRTNEQAATQAALDALQSVSAGAKETVESFLQISASSKTNARMNNELAKLIRVGKEVGSVELVQMATKLQQEMSTRLKHKQDYMGTDQQSFYDQGKFGPVLKLLNDLITRLEEEQAAETSQHEWCETEKANSVAAKTDREKTIHGLKASIEAKTTTTATLKTEILFEESEIKRVEKETKVAKKIRAEEKEVFETEKADHEEVIKAIETALEALGGQYGFLQLAANHRGTGARSGQPEAGNPFSDYSSGSGGAGSAMEMLTDLQERYSAALKELITDENTSQKLHDDLLKKNAKFVADTTESKNAKLAERRATLTSLGDDKEDMKTNLLELHEVSKYLRDLRPSCDDIRSTFEERKKRREAEIAALKEALEVISDPSMS